jgi:hypothetical protein
MVEILILKCYNILILNQFIKSLIASNASAYSQPACTPLALANPFIKSADK